LDSLVKGGQEDKEHLDEVLKVLLETGFDPDHRFIWVDGSQIGENRAEPRNPRVYVADMPMSYRLREMEARARTISGYLSPRGV
jgi:hypothetical protein